jgi:phosphoserine aminotransferase
MASPSLPESFAAWQRAPGYSFTAAAGPLPAEVASEVAAACRPGPGSLLGLPFTSPTFRALQAETEACLRRLLAIPDRFRVLFLAGGASAQFAALPLNLLGEGGWAVYLDSGHWARRAIAEARRHGPVTVLPAAAPALPPGPPPAYVHLTSNETADGLRYPELPDLPAPLAADMTSDLLTRPIAWQRVGVAYAATQKLIGTPGLTLVVVREDLLGRARPPTPRVLDYRAQAEADSRLSTPPVLPIFVAHRMLHWLEARGGVAGVSRRLAERSAHLEAALAAGTGLYRRLGAPSLRSPVNPCFHLSDEGLTEAFLAAAEAAGLRDLRGHPQTGGVRVSLYPGLAEEAVAALAAFLRAFPRCTHRVRAG